MLGLLCSVNTFVPKSLSCNATDATNKKGFKFPNHIDYSYILSTGFAESCYDT